MTWACNVLKFILQTQLLVRFELHIPFLCSHCKLNPHFSPPVLCNKSGTLKISVSLFPASYSFTPPHLLSLALIHSFLFYPSQLFNPKPCMFCKHTHSHLYSRPCLFPATPSPTFVYISHHALYLDLPLMKALDWAETFGKNCDNRHLSLDSLG